MRHLKDLITKSIEHPGLAYLDVLQPCPTYNDINTREWYQGMGNIDEDTHKQKPRIYKLEDTGFDGRVRSEETHSKMVQAIEKSNQWDDKIPIGLFYQNEQIPTYKERIDSKIPSYVKNPPAKQTIMDQDGLPTGDITKLLESLRIDR